jgi:PhnB protein
VAGKQFACPDFCRRLGCSFAQAVEAGAEVLSPITDTFFGSREGRVLDPFGSTWTISTHTENVSVEEMQQRLNALAA